jgi:hypothetical protein
MKRIFSLLSAAFLLGLISLPLLAQPVSETELESLVRQRSLALAPREQRQLPLALPQAERQLAQAAPQSAPQAERQLVQAPQEESLPVFVPLEESQPVFMPQEESQSVFMPQEDVDSGPTYAELSARIRQLEAELVRLGERTEQLEFQLGESAAAPAPAATSTDPLISETQGTLDKIVAALESIVGLVQQVTSKDDVASKATYDALVARIHDLGVELSDLRERTDQLTLLLNLSGVGVSDVDATPPPPPPPPEPSIGTAQGAFTLDGILAGETSLGDALCDVSAYYFRITSLYQQHVDFAFHDGGLFQAGLNEGPITEKEILDILPEDTYLVYGSIRGSDLIKLVQEIPNIPQGDPLFIQVSDDVKYTIDYANGELSNLTIGGAPVDPIRYYVFVTNIELFNSAPEEILALTLNTKVTTYTLTDVVFDAIWFIGDQGWSLFPYTDGRISVVGGK